MSTPASCPFCSYEVVPARGPSGALVCPLCRNTGKTERPDAASFRRALNGFETRLLDQLGRVQSLLVTAVQRSGPDDVSDVAERMTHLEQELRELRAHAGTGAMAMGSGRTATADTGDGEERVARLEARVDDVAARVETATTATAIRLDAVPDKSAMDDMIRAIEALQQDIRALHEAYDREAVPELRQQVRVLARSVRDLEKRQESHTRHHASGAEWERPSPWTMEEAEAPVPSAREWSADEEDLDQEGRESENQVEAEPPLITAEGFWPRMGTSGPREDFSGVPPVMDDRPSMRDLVARDAIRMPEGDATPSSDPLERIEMALFDIDERLRHLRDR